MKKAQRLEEITRLIQQKGTIRISEIVDSLGVTDMTVRRDFGELEKQGILTKIHGGARSTKAFQYREFSHFEKHTYNIEEKKAIAKMAVKLIEPGDTLFLGPGTTVECLAIEIRQERLTVITNCLPVFNILLPRKSETFQVFLLGGEMRQVTESFIGDITNTILETMHFSKIFFSGNAIKGDAVMTSTYTEAYTQRMAISRSVEKYLLIDSTKIGRDDFSTITALSDLTAVITDTQEEEKIMQLTPYVEVINTPVDEN